MKTKSSREIKGIVFLVKNKKKQYCNINIISLADYLTRVLTHYQINPLLGTRIALQSLQRLGLNLYSDIKGHYGSIISKQNTKGPL